MTKINVMAGLAILGLAIGVSGAANAQLINGSFEMNTGNGQVGYNTTVTGWTVPAGGYTFLYAPGTADTTGANGQYGGLSLWGPGNGVANGLPATSPDGGYFIAQDSAFQTEPIQQTLTGLTPGASYTVGFYWGAAQQTGFFGPTFDAYQVSLGSQTQTTNTVNLPSQGFSPWTYQSFTFTADSASPVLSFLATGGPNGVPPFALLDGVTLTANTPEPGAMTALFAGVLGFGAFARRRARK